MTIEKGAGIDRPTTLTRNYLIGAFAACWLLLASLRTSATAQNQGGVEPAPTPTPMMLPVIPQIQLQAVPAYGPAPLTVGFMVSSLNPDTVLQTFAWNFGDGQVSMLPPTMLFHTYTKPGSYVVTVTVTTADGHQASSLAGVTVTQPPH